MNIKEIEARSGLARANIRYYEKEGLLNPARRENGYRDYSEEDLKLLEKIRLMRELGISLEEIRELEKTPDSLSAIIEQRIKAIDEEVLNLNDVVVVCSEIQFDQVSFDTMETARYLKRLGELAGEREQNQINSVAVNVRKLDQEPPVLHPWRRFLARMMDWSFCGCLIDIIWYGFLKCFPGDGLISSTVTIVAAMGMMLVLEPLFLACFGTTPGKWIFGIHIAEQNGRRLTYSEAFHRTGSVLLHGMGLNIPVYEWYCWYRCYRAYTDGHTMEWDLVEYVDYQFNERQLWKMITYTLLVGIVSCGNIYLIGEWQLLPPNRGNLTVDEFVENHNKYVTLLDRLNGTSLAANSCLDQTGQYQWSESEKDYIVQTQGGIDQEPPIWKYKTEGGMITEISFEEMIHTSNPIQGYGNEMIYAILAFGSAQEDITVWNRGMHRLLDRTEAVGFVDYEFTEAGIHVMCHMEYDGKDIPRENFDMQWLYSADDEVHDYYIKFVIEKVSSY